MTLAPTVWFIDSGELAAVASTLGIAHPTGYPLFTIIGYIFSKLPVSGSEIYKLNMMSAFFCTLGIFMFFLLLNYIFSSKEKEDRTDKKQKKQQVKPAETAQALPAIIKYGIIIASCLMLAFSKTYWGAANSVEVYPLHIFFIITLMLVFIKAVSANKIFAENTLSGFIKENKFYLLFALLLGLSFTNHMTTILLAPACLTLFFTINKSSMKLTPKLLALMAVCFIIGFSVYLYLPIRASQNPVLLWGNPISWERFVWHLTGKQFSVWIFSAQGSVPIFLLLLSTLLAASIYGLLKQKTVNPNYHFAVLLGIAVLSYLLLSSGNEIAAKQFKAFSSSLWREFGIGMVILSLFGAYKLSFFNTKIFYFTLLTFFGCLFYSVNYDIYDIYSYFLLSYITLVIWIGFGFYWLYDLIASSFNTSAKRIGYSAAVVIFSFAALYGNYAENDESKNYYIEQFTMNVFENVEPNGIVISSQWDFWLSASWYFHFVKNIRPDIVTIDKELLRRSWYFTFLERNYPEVYNNSKAEIDRFQVELYKFEHGIPYDQVLIARLFSELVSSFVTKNPGRKVYTTWEIEQNKNEQFALDYARIPDGLLFRIVKPDELKNNILPDFKLHNFKFTRDPNKGYYHETLMYSYAFMFTVTAGYLATVLKTEDAKKYLELALTAMPGFPNALEVKRRFNL
jgi:hypothetical protein